MTNACLWHMGFSIIWLVLQSLSTRPPHLSNESAIRPWDSWCGGSSGGGGAVCTSTELCALRCTDDKGLCNSLT